ncbi:TRAP transporter substrate-binding protein DctP [Paracoccus halophilus]|nr:TRAP transporter substrate-binding protein DctP [Paracoccus halophilus]
MAEEIILAHGENPGNPRYEAAQLWADTFTECTGGEYTVLVAPSATLGDDAETLTSASAGVIQVTASSQGTTSQMVPEMGLLGLPFLFQDLPTAWEVLDGEIGALLDARAEETNLKILGNWDNGIVDVARHDQRERRRIGEIDLQKRLTHVAALRKKAHAVGIGQLPPARPLIGTENALRLQMHAHDVEIRAFRRVNRDPERAALIAEPFGHPVGAAIQKEWLCRPVDKPGRRVLDIVDGQVRVRESAAVRSDGDADALGRGAQSRVVGAGGKPRTLDMGEPSDFGYGCHQDLHIRCPVGAFDDQEDVRVEIGELLAQECDAFGDAGAFVFPRQPGAADVPVAGFERACLAVDEVVEPFHVPDDKLHLRPRALRVADRVQASAVS